jgi:hypothetical protein
MKNTINTLTKFFLEFNQYLIMQLINKLTLLLFGIDSSKALRQYISLIIKLTNNNSPIFMMKYMKRAKLHITKYIAGEPLFVNSDRVSIDKEGWPTALSEMKELVILGPNGLRTILTIISFTRALVPTKYTLSKIKPDYSSITDPYTGSRKYYIPAKFIKDFLKLYAVNYSQAQELYKDHYVSTKGSPSGPATYTSLLSLMSYPQELYNHICTLLFWRDQEILFRMYTSLTSYPKYILNMLGLTAQYEKRKSNLLGKLSFINDPEFKLRIIAMVDYYSQWVLKPIHKHALSILSTIPMDRTYTQDPSHSWEQNDHKFWSLDLSSATDRFPVYLQYSIVKWLYDSKKATSWLAILTQRTYESPSGDQLKYSVGQPMGAYSSWAIFTLTHHLAVNWAAFLCGFELGSFNQYIILGDDIVIKNDNVAKKYKQLMKIWGVGISEPKTHVSKDTYEFAKRWIQNMTEISGIPLKGIICNIGNPSIILSNIFNYVHKMKILPISGNVLELTGALYSGLNIKGRYMSKYSIIKRLSDFYIMLRYAHEFITYDELRTYLGRKLHTSTWDMLPASGEMPSFLKGILSHGIRNTIESGANKYANSLKPFDNLSQYDYESFRRNFEINCTPFYCGVYNTLRRYIDIFKKALDPVLQESNGFLDLVEGILTIHTDKIALMHRGEKEKLILMDKIWKDSFKKILHPDYLDQLFFDISINGTNSTEIFPSIVRLGDPLVMMLDSILEREHEPRFGTNSMFAPLTPEQDSKEFILIQGPYVGNTYKVMVPHLMGMGSPFGGGMMGGGGFGMGGGMFGGSPLSGLSSDFFKVEDQEENNDD